MPAAPQSAPFILASASPRRLALLAQIGVTPDRVIAAEGEESARKGELPRGLARRLAREKCRAVADDNPDCFVLGADTVVACGRRVLPKAADEAGARRCLELLSGRRHRVWGGICVAAPDGRVVDRVAVTDVVFKRLSKEEVDAYIAGGEWRDKAGAYGIQGAAAVFVRKIIGSYSNVVGLCLYETHAVLRGLGCAPGG